MSSYRKIKWKSYTTFWLSNCGSRSESKFGLNFVNRILLFFLRIQHVVYFVYAMLFHFMRIPFTCGAVALSYKTKSLSYQVLPYTVLCCKCVLGKHTILNFLHSNGWRQRVSNTKCKTQKSNYRQRQPRKHRVNNTIKFSSFRPTSNKSFFAQKCTDRGRCVKVTDKFCKQLDYVGVNPSWSWDFRWVWFEFSL